MTTVFGFVYVSVAAYLCVCVCSCSHTVNQILFISLSREGATNFFFYCFLASTSEQVCALVWVCNLDTLVLWFTLFPSNHREKKCLHSLAVAGASQPMCWLQGPAHIHMFPVCLAQQDTGWLHALLIIPTAQALQGHKPNSIFQHTLVNIMAATALETWYYGRDKRTNSSVCCLPPSPASPKEWGKLSTLASHCKIVLTCVGNFTFKFLCISFCQACWIAMILNTS